MSENTHFNYIEIARVVSETGSSVNIGSRPEVLETDRIKSFRIWIKGKNDEKIKGEMCILMVKKEGEEKLKSVLIEESYTSFRDRFNKKIPVNRIKE